MSVEITLRDIARELDVSAMTVSRSLRHDNKINPETRARVNEVAHRLGYIAPARRPRRVVEPEIGARSLGLLLRHNSLQDVQGDINLTRMMSGIMSVSDDNRILLNVHTIHHGDKRRIDEDPSAVPPMVQERVCQAIIVRGEFEDRDIAFLLEHAPVISMGRIYPAKSLDAATADNEGGISALVTHLVELGHQRLAWVGVGHTASFMRARQTGFLRGCLDHGLSVGNHSFHGPELYAESDTRTDGLLEVVQSGVTAFVCGNDYVARRMVTALLAAGLRVPEDVSVTGFDAAPNRGNSLTLTSVDPHFTEIGEAAAQLALQRIARPQRQPRTVSVRGDVVLGESTAPPRKQ